MTSLAFVAPCLPGGADVLRHLAQEARGARRGEFEDFHQRMSLTDETRTFSRPCKVRCASFTCRAKIRRARSRRSQP
jgi:hypothetical protein